VLWPCLQSTHLSADRQPLSLIHDLTPNRPDLTPNRPHVPGRREQLPREVGRLGQGDRRRATDPVREERLEARDQIVAYCKYPVTMGKIEGFNNTVSRIVHRACGVRDLSYLFLKCRQAAEPAEKLVPVTDLFD